MVGTATDGVAGGSSGAAGAEARGGARRAVWGLADQALSSASNFLVTVLAARAVAPRHFGAFALAMASYAFVAFVVRGIAGDPLVTRFSAAEGSELHAAARAANGTAMAVGLFAVAPVAAIGLVMGHIEGSTLTTLAVLLPGLLVQDNVRFICFAMASPQRAAVNDAVWMVLQLAAMVPLILHGHPSSADLVLAWGAAGNVAAIIGLVQVGLVPDLRRCREWLHLHRDLWRYYALENGFIQGTNLLVLYVVAATSGLAAAGSLRGAVTLFGPLIVLALGAMGAGVPELVRVAARDVGRMRTLALAAGAALAATTAAWGAFLIVAPDTVGRALLGQTWHLSRSLVPFLLIDAMAAMFVIGPFAGLRALGAAQRSLRTRVVMSALRLVAAAVGGSVGGARGAALGFAVVAPIQCVGFTRQLDAHCRDHEAVLAGQPCPELPGQVANPSARVLDGGDSNRSGRLSRSAQ